MPKEAFVGQPEWLSVALQNSWANSGAPFGFYKDQFGRVHLRGGLNGGTHSSGVLIATLPLDYRPPYNHRVIGWSDDGSSVTVACRIEVGTDGTIRIYDMGAGNDISINGINFSTHA